MVGIGNKLSQLRQLQNEIEGLKQECSVGATYRIDNDGFIVETSAGIETRMTEAEFITKMEEEIKAGISVRRLDSYINENCSILKKYEHKRPLKKGDLKLEDLIMKM